jgi:hypothetical protein
MSKLDDIICKHMVDVDHYGFIAEEDERPCKEEVKALVLELVGEDVPANEDYGGGGRAFQARMRAKIREL